eukprot:TRINITY_DN26288_c0_g1_i1.p1 TRINITY_DN26288_c0_g1~~TRINITY_DN26288_c0_g1_i1.p1  ORF type:complete len:329 (+),score=87.96 TRINITY_DN26288_c0_g1_i1:249-1235(+)
MGWGNGGKGQSSWSSGGWNSWSGGGSAAWQGRADDSWSRDAWSQGAWSQSQGSTAHGRSAAPRRPAEKSGGGGGEALALALAPPTPEQLARLEVSFCPDPRSVGAKFTGTYEKAPRLNFASLNAGDMKLMVGGATMNGQFAKDLETLAGQQPRAYQVLHSEAFRAATAAQQLLSASPAALRADPNLEACYLRLSRQDQKVGVAFVDIFKEDRRPHDKKNVAMVYTVGPQRRDCPSDAAFLAEVRLLASNVAAACSEYNAAGSEPRLEQLRVCLVSGGAFAGGVPKLQIATALCSGLAEGALEKHAPAFEFAFDGDVFKTAWDALNLKK